MASTTMADTQEATRLTERLQLNCFSPRHVKRATLIWAIENFMERMDTAEKLQRPPSEDFVKSDIFSIPIKNGKGEVNNLKFVLKIEWNNTGVSKAHLGIYLISLTVDSPFTIKYDFSIKSGEATNALELAKKISYCKVFNQEVTSWGCPTAFSKSNIRKYPGILLENSSLTIVTNLEVICESSQEIKVQIPTNLVQGYLGQRLWDSRDKTADITLVCQDTKVLAHKNVLTASSDVLEAMFNFEDMAESKTKTIHFKDISPACLEGFLYWIYFNKLSEDTTTVDFVQELLMAAEKYNVVDLKIKCEHKLSTMTNDSNVGQIGAHANMYNASYLRDYVIHYVANNYHDLVRESGGQWKILPSDIIKDALALSAK